jgi:quercetin dioxygenase-like cupin family protein
LLGRCVHVQEVLAKLQCPVRAVRFLRLGPGSTIKEHADPDLGFHLGEVRLHIAVASNPEVEFVVGGARVQMSEGECWYHDFGKPHRVYNGGDSPRVHLVIDCVVNDWLRALLTEPQ